MVVQNAGFQCRSGFKPGFAISVLTCPMGIKLLQHQLPRLAVRRKWEIVKPDPNNCFSSFKCLSGDNNRPPHNTPETTRPSRSDGSQGLERAQLAAK